jgi:hypothetical protein
LAMGFVDHRRDADATDSPAPKAFASRLACAPQSKQSASPVAPKPWRRRIRGKNFLWCSEQPRITQPSRGVTARQARIYTD